jgi:hypothetical protein
MLRFRQKLPPLVLVKLDPLAFSPRTSALGIRGPLRAPRQRQWMPGTRSASGDEELFWADHQISSGC